MKCIVKSIPEFKALENVFGEALAEKYVQDYSVLVRKIGLNDEYYYPTPQEVKDWLTNDKSKIAENARKAFETNPFLTEKAIKTLLAGVIHPLKGKFYVTRGFTNYGSIVEQKAAEEYVFKPNVNIVKALAEKFPNIISVKQSDKNAFTVEVSITPLVERAQADEVEEEPMVSYDDVFDTDPEQLKKDQAREIATKLGQKFSKAFKIPYTMVSKIGRAHV